MMKKHVILVCYACRSIPKKILAGQSGVKARREGISSRRVLFRTQTTSISPQQRGYRAVPLPPQPSGWAEWCKSQAPEKLKADAYSFIREDLSLPQ
ncbi:MAG: hypothetical protein ACNI3A_11350 [Desulfovibrio sp.]|uniref:hypothetical protein n=1 Tax=Desulfovibrio sp. 7SRBS1 TaxID=3378064 RepID=UPI003B3D0521